MKRKEYIQPEVQVVNMEASTVIAGSTPEVGGAATDEDAGAASYRNNLWDN